MIKTKASSSLKAHNPEFNSHARGGVPPQDSVPGIGTSSVIVCLSISFGMANAVTIFSCNVALSEAWATVVCNLIRPDVHSILERIDLQEVSGVFVIMGDQHVKWGNLPPVVRADVDERLISAGDRIWIRTIQGQYDSCPAGKFFSFRPPAPGNPGTRVACSGR
ncbi:MAG: hypothetical protein NTZ37_06555 [Methanoregula sp.]|nr:hypothetical protein [Methanoregula sp.]